MAYGALVSPRGPQRVCDWPRSAARPACLRAGTDRKRTRVVWQSQPRVLAKVTPKLLASYVCDAAPRSVALSDDLSCASTQAVSQRDFS